MAGIPPDFPEHNLPEPTLKRHEMIMMKYPGRILMNYNWRRDMLEYFDPGENPGEN